MPESTDARPVRTTDESIERAMAQLADIADQLTEDLIDNLQYHGATESEIVASVAGHLEAFADVAHIARMKLRAFIETGGSMQIH